jgi:hypothetical protein
MRILLSLSFLLLLAAPKSFGQNVDKDLLLKWGVLKSNVKQRANLVLEMTSDFLKQGKDDKKIVFKTNVLAKVIKSDTIKEIDSKIVKAFYNKNDSLENQAFEILISPKIEKNAATSKRLDILVEKLDAIEKVIKKARKDYNTACRDKKREDLLYENTTQVKDVKVQF